MTPEKAVQNKIIKYLHDLEKHDCQVYCERRQAGGYSYKVGIADVYAVFSGYHIEIEVKARGGELRPMQERWRDECQELGILWICVDDLQQLIDFINNVFIIEIKDGVTCYKRK